MAKQTLGSARRSGQLKVLTKDFTEVDALAEHIRFNGSPAWHRLQFNRPALGTLISYVSHIGVGSQIDSFPSTVMASA